MKILIPYDGSKNAEAVLHRLQTDKFGQNHEALFLVSDVFLPETRDEFWQAVAERRRKMQASGISSHAPARRRLEEEQVILRELRERVALMFPTWKARVEILPGESLASSEILEAARKFQPDVLVLGQKSVSAKENTGYGEAARRVAKEAGCRIFFAGDNQDFREESNAQKNRRASLATAFGTPPVRSARQSVTKPKFITAVAAAA